MPFHKARVIDKAAPEPPQIRQSVTLKDFQPQKFSPVPALKTPFLGEKTTVFPKGMLFVNILLFTALGLAVFTNTRLHRSNKEYEKLNKDLYQISLSLKQKLAATERGLQTADRIKEWLADSRGQVMTAYQLQAGQYRDVSRQYSSLLAKAGDYQQLLKVKSAWVNQTAGELRVAEARIEALKAQQGVLLAQVEEKAGQVAALTSQMMTGMNQQKELINENLDLQKELEKLRLKDY